MSGYFYRPERRYKPRPAEPETEQPIHAMEYVETREGDYDFYMCLACLFYATLEGAIKHAVANQWTA